jgi:hypothetical protein
MIKIRQQIIKRKIVNHKLVDISCNPFDLFLLLESLDSFDLVDSLDELPNIKNGSTLLFPAWLLYPQLAKQDGSYCYLNVGL